MSVNININKAPWANTKQPLGPWDTLARPLKGVYDWNTGEDVLISTSMNQSINLQR